MSGWHFMRTRHSGGQLLAYQVLAVCRVMMDTMQEAAIVVHKHNGDIMKFQESSNGLYYYNATKPTSTELSDYSFINTVANNKSLYTTRQLKDADTAKRLYTLVGRPSYAAFITMIRNNLLLNCPITVDDANRALTIYGPDVAALKGKTTRRTPSRVPSNLLCPLPLSLLAIHRSVTICFDIFFVDGFAFLATVSRDIHFVTVEHIPSRAIIKHVLPCFKRVNNLYRARGFSITMAHAGEEFSSLRDPLLELNNINLNIAATDKHVPEIERVIRTIKKRNRAAVSALPFKNYPKLLKCELINHAVTWLNLLTHADGISETLSPRTIITGASADFNTHCRVPFGTYCEAHNDNHPSNTETPRTSSTIALNPTGNLQGSYRFLSLDTGKPISQRKWTELPITQAIIDRVHVLATAEKIHNGDAPNFQFTWGLNNPIIDIDDDNHDPALYTPDLDGAEYRNDEQEQEEQEERPCLQFYFQSDGRQSRC